ncbi:MAG TPA: MnhB domain-containing protein [Acidimicrobiales bacterium]|nr:MnhB domain-containing protein [Acidimicrobiales bacterium]
MTTSGSLTRHRVAAAAVVAGTATFLGGAFVDLPTETAELPGIARDAITSAIPDWHDPEVVSVVVYGTRGFDTFGETFLLLAAVVGVIVVCRGRERRRVFLQEERLGRREQAEARRARGEARRGRRRQEVEHAEDIEQGQAEDSGEGDAGIGARGHVSAPAMTVVVRTAARPLLLVLVVAGAYLLALAFTPGGGFPAGGVLAGVVLLAYVAYGYRAVRRVVRPALLEAFELAGAAAIIAIEVVGLVLKGSMSANWLPIGQEKTFFGGGILPAFSAAEFVEVATGVLIAVFSLLAMEREWTEADQEEAGAERNAGEATA